MDRRPLLDKPFAFFGERWERLLEHVRDYLPKHCVTVYATGFLGGMEPRYRRCMGQDAGESCSELGIDRGVLAETAYEAGMESLDVLISVRKLQQRKPDRIGDRLYTLSGRAVKANALSDLAELASVPLPQAPVEIGPTKTL